MVRLKGLGRYWDQYVRYQMSTPSFQGDINHIIDHGYGHLLRSLPAEKSIVTFHDSTASVMEGISWRTRLAVRYSLAAMQKAACVITDSEKSREGFLKLVPYPEKKVHVVYPGIDRAFRVLPDQEKIREVYQLPKSFILHVGHNLPYMNLDQVLLTMESLLKDKRLDVHLVKVGEPFTKKQEAILERSDLKKKVLHLGKVSLQDLVSIYNCAEMLFYPVYYAGFGLPPLEAMACGTPVLCSNRGSLPEILGDAALMVDLGDHEKIVEAVALLLTDQNISQRYRMKGLRRAESFTWEETAHQVLAIYRNVYEAN